MSIIIHLVSLALIILGIVGAVIQVIPSGVLVGLAVLIWAIYLGTTGAWVVFTITAVILLAATLAKFALPGRQLNQSGIPKSSLIVGLSAAILGYFIIPVVGFVLGLVIGVYVMEYRRTATVEQAKKRNHYGTQSRRALHSDRSLRCPRRCHHLGCSSSLLRNFLKSSNEGTQLEEYM